MTGHPVLYNFWISRGRKARKLNRSIPSSVVGAGFACPKAQSKLFRASEPRPYKLSDSIIHVLTHFFSEWGKPQEVIELPSDLDIVNVFIMK